MEPLRADPELAPLIAEHGELRLEPAEDPFARLVVSIINQQLSVQSATAIEERLFDRFEVTPAAMLAADEAALREVGFSEAKVEYVWALARAFASGRLDVAAMRSWSDEEIAGALTEVKGFGDWTAKMALMFVFGREDVFPVEDLGVRRGMTVLYGMEERDAMVAKAEDWRPYRSIASRYLWLASE